MTAFEHASALAREDAGQYTAAIEPAWLQGKGVFGGLIAALVTRAIADTVADDAFQLRTLTCHFCDAVVPGPATLSVEVVRTGRSVMHVAARVVSDAATACIASATLARDRDIDLAHERVSMPSAPGVERVPENDRPAGPATPPFIQFFDYRVCVGQQPFSAADTAFLGGWIRFQSPLVIDTPAAVAMTDAAPPAVFATMSRPRPAATMAMTFHILAPLPLADATADDYYLLTGRSDMTRHGYSVQDNELWSRRGQLLVRAHQMFAIIK